MKELHRYFTYIVLLIAVQWDKTIQSVFTTSHQFPDHAGNTHRTEFQFPCWVFWSRVLTHYALRGIKQFREIYLTWDIWEWKVWVGGWNTFPFHLKQTKKIFLAQGTHRESYCWKYTFCFRGCPHFWQYPFICLAGYSRKLFWCNNIELNTKKMQVNSFLDAYICEGSTGCLASCPLALFTRHSFSLHRWMKTKRLTQPVYKYVLVLSMIASQRCCASLMCWASVTTLI